MLKELFASILLSGSIGAKSLPVTVPVPHELVTQVNETYEKNVQVRGVYNFRQNPHPYSESYYVHRFVIEDIGTQQGGGPYYKHLCPFALNGGHLGQFYLLDIEIEVDDGLASFEFRCYDGNENIYTYSTSWGSSLANVQYKELMFYCLTNITLTGLDGYIFDNYFTHDDNDYVITYSGDYTFVNGLSSFSDKFSVFGNTLFSNRLGYGFTNEGFQSSQFGFYQYDLTTGYYDLTLVELPFNRSVITTSYVVFSGVKMSTDTHVLLETTGVFGYIRDMSHDNDNLKDLIFDVMDTPIYFLSRLLSFELFGVNLFMALCSLLTVVIIIFCLKKFM